MKTPDNNIRIGTWAERRYEVVVQNALQAVVVVDRFGVIQIANPAVRRIFGYEESELIGQRLEILIPAKYRESHQSFIEIYLATGVSEIIQKGRIIEIQRKDGATRQVFIRVHETIIGEDHFFTAILEDLSTDVLLKHRLKEGEELLRILLDSNPSGVFMSDASATRNVYVNSELCAIYEMPEEQLLERGRWSEIVHPDDMPHILKVMQESVQSRSPAEVVHRVVTPQGNLKWVHVRANPYYRLGEFAGFVGIVVDVTQSKKIEQEIHEQKELLNEITRMVPAGVVYIKADRRYAFVNTGAEKIWNRPADQFIGFTPDELIPAEYLPAMKARLDAALAGNIQHFEKRLTGPDGRSRSYIGTYVPHVRGDSVIGVTGTAVDVTEIREKTDQLAIYEEIVRGMSEGVFLVQMRKSLPIVYMNPVAARLLGAVEAIPLDASVNALIAHFEPRKRIRVMREILMTVRRGNVWSGEISLWGTKPPFTPVLLRVRRIHSQRYGDVLLVSVTDITKEIAAREELQDQRDKAKAATEAKSRFLAHISHEIRNPLNALIGYAQILESMSDIPPQAMRMIEAMIPAGRTLFQIINEVLDLEKIESGKMTVNDEAVFIDDLLQDLKSTLTYRTLADGTQFEIQCSAGAPKVVCADRAKFYQILLNLTTNAANYSPKGSTVKVKVEESESELRCEVIDQGPGVPAAFESRLFTPFERAASTQARGTGLGLFIASEYARLMGGRLEYERLKPGPGAVFCFILPLRAVPQSAETEKPARRFHVQRRFPGLRVLVVDDDSVNRLMIQSALEMVGCTVHAVHDAESALVAAPEFLPQIVFSDHQMPGMSGLQLLSKFRLNPALGNVRRVLVTGDLFTPEVQGLVEGAVDELLSKPFALGDMYNILAKFFAAQVD